MVSEIEIQQLVNEIVEGYKPEKIYLFGSYANGTPNNDSDIDLFIIKETLKRRNERTIDVIDAIKNYPSTGIDFIIYTPQEFEAIKNDVVNIGKEAVTTGKLLYERI